MLNDFTGADRVFQSVSFTSSRWNAMVERVDVLPEGRIVFHFVCGREIVV